MGNRDAMEALKWHEKLFKQHWIERRPEPLEMTGEEAWEWFNEYGARLEEKDNRWICTFFLGEKFIADTAFGAVCAAAAIYKEMNE